MKTLIRCDSSSTIGHGHVKRCMVLASRLQNVSFACRSLKGSITNQIKEKVYVLKSRNLDELIKLINHNNFSHLIIDNYDINYEDEKEIKKNTGVKLTIIDDEVKKHFCDELINPNICITKQQYKDLVPLTCVVKCGQNYILVRDEFYKEAKIKRDKIYDYLIMLGGVDILNLSKKVALSLEKNSKIAILTSTGNKNLKELQEFVDKQKNISLFVDTKDVAKKMNQSKELIITPSTICNEALVLGSKFKIIEVANNQSRMSHFLQQKGYQLIKLEDL